VQDLKGMLLRMNIHTQFLIQLRKKIDTLEKRNVLNLNYFVLFIGSIRVYCRIRPFLPGQVSSSTVGCIDDGNITIITPSKSGKEGRKSFTFNKVFGPSSTQGILPFPYF
jgi:hypothetical protein